MTVNERVSCALKGQKATQRDLAAAIGVSTSTLNNWLKLGRDIPAQYIVPICEFFDVSLSFLLTGSETEKAPVPGISENGREMLALYEKLPEREQVLEFLRSLPTHFELTVGEQKFYLVHGLPADTVYDEVWHRPYKDPIPPMTDCQIIVGHTPVSCFVHTDTQAYSRTDEEERAYVQQMCARGEKLTIFHHPQSVSYTHLRAHET